MKGFIMQRSVSVILFAGLLFSLSLQAGQVYTCKDGNGRKTFQQTPCLNQTITVSGPAYELLSDMRKLSNRGMEINALIGPTVTAIKQCNHNVDVYSAEIAKIQPRLAPFQYKHKDLAKAYVQLQECASCRSAAANNCQSANQYLDIALAKMNK
ncbi:MAG: DUF4124 domain-containing protein [Pseudomonadales bacterium]|nr:DUF4124 domain-containing protein [Pseudomonadales bacterium]